MAHGVLACFLVGDFRRLSDCRLHRQPSQAPELGTGTEHQILGIQVS